MRASLVALTALVLALPSQAEARKRPLPLGDELRLDLTDPIVTARIGDVALRLRVDFDQRDSIELNPEAAARLPLPFEPGGDAEVGRVLLPGRMAMARLTIAGQEAEIQLATHDRTCCEGADGAIGAALMPFETIRLVGRVAPAAQEQVFAMDYSRDGGLVIRQSTPAGAVLVQFSLRHSGAHATKSAGTILLRAYGGRLETGYSRIIGPFGVERPVRALALKRPARLAGFVVDHLQVRTADFGGRRTFPEEGPRPGDILVRKRVKAHHDWPAILLGREYIGRCSEIVFQTISRTLSLRCPSL
jgi:hypothetical protein